jgi:hypothetical protein
MNARRTPTTLLIAASVFTLQWMPQTCLSADAERPPSADGKERPRISAHLASTLKRANDAFRAKDYELALKELDAADALGNKSEYDQRIIDQLRTAATARKDAR